MANGPHSPERSSVPSTQRAGASAWEEAHRAGVHPETGEQVGPWYLPRSVVRCLASSWSWLLELPTGELVVHPYTCGSWRCPDCAWKPAKELCERLEATLSAKDRRELVFLTLTLPRNRNPYDAMRELGSMTRRLVKRLRYDLGLGVGRHRIRAPLSFALVFEAHKDPRWLHGHAIVWSPALADRLRRDGWFPSWNPVKGRNERRYRYATTGALADAARAVGFGRVDAQPVSSPGAVTRYLAKLSRELSGGERKGQLPLLAPPRFRRVRSTPGFLQRLEKIGTAVAAELVRHPAAAAQAALDSGDERLASSLARLVAAAGRIARRVGLTRADRLALACNSPP